MRSDDNNHTARLNPRGGRPRLDAQEGWLEELREVMPHLHDGTVTQREAARLLRCSVRSLWRYAARL